MSAATGSLTSASAGTPIALQGDFNITLSGTFIASLTLERNFDDGTTWLPVTFSDGVALAFTAAQSTTWSEPERGVIYRVRCTEYTSGTINWRLSQ